MAKKIDFDDLIRKGEDIKALRFLAKELYSNNMIGGTRKRFLDKVADDFDKTIDTEAYANKRAIELIKENERLKESLRKCSPLEQRTLVEETGVWCFCCKFCRQIQASDTREFHTENCEYVRLTGLGDINVGKKDVGAE